MTGKGDGKRSFAFMAVIALSTCIWSILAGCNYGRMNDQDSIRTYEGQMPVADKRTIPVNDGFETLSHADPRSLRNPLPYVAHSIDKGRRVYSYFCVQCHGVKLDGNGTVGQSFAPLPTDLVSRTTLSQQDGELYAKVRLGFKRHPVLFPTISAEDAWAVIIYMRSAGRRDDY